MRITLGSSPLSPRDCSLDEPLRIGNADVRPGDKKPRFSRAFLNHICFHKYYWTRRPLIFYCDPQGYMRDIQDSCKLIPCKK
jgi:hypothetical protein